MKKILIPTDFSPIADNALNYAIEIAAKFNSELYLHHVYSMRQADYDLHYSDEEQPYIKDLQQRMNFTKRKFIEKVTKLGLSLTTVIEEDHIYALFKTKVIEQDIDLIVMGSKGASGLEKVVFGSAASAALDLAKVPVLIVPPIHSFQPLRNIVLAIDANKDYNNILKPLKKLALKFESKITSLHVNTGKNIDEQNKINSFLEDVEISHRSVPMSKSINNSINEFIKTNQFDLLCMIRREKGFFESLFQRSITRDQAFNSRIPLLVLPES